MASREIEMPTLGRPFTLGMLYDARTDELRSGFTLWDKNTIEANTKREDRNFTTFKVTTSDSIKEKSSLLDIEASLSASFLSGLFDVGRSAKYLNDNKKFKNQSRVTLHYKATTHYKGLSFSHQEVNDMQVAAITDNFSATHVVTGILYGANAFFVFDSERLDERSIKDIEEKMQAAMRKITSYSVEAKVDVKLSDGERNATNKFSCKFYGDFILQNNPVSFEDAVKTYRELPNLLGKKGENAVPVKVFLTPLSYYMTAETVKNKVDDKLLRNVQEALDEMREIEMRCNDVLEDETVEKFPELKEKVRNFHNLCNDYTTKLKMTMMEKFPAIRAGKEDESSVRKLFDEKEKSPFSHENLDKWLDNTEREINVIQSYEKKMKGTVVKIVANKSELEREVLTPGVDHTLCFTFTSSGTDDPYLKQMADYLSSNESLSDKNVTPPAEDQWYNLDEVLSKLRKNADEFCNLAKALKRSSRFRFLVTVLPDKNQKGAAIYHYKEGKLRPDIFSKPQIHNPKTVTDRRDLLWYATELTLDPKTVNNYLFLFDGNKRVACGSWQVYSDIPERFNECPQVLCKEGLTGIHYWEVEWKSAVGGDGVAVGVAYDGIPRKGKSSVTGLGYHVNSWCFGKDGGAIKAWVGGEVWSNPVPSHGCNRVAVFLNCPAGTLSFYSISSNTLTHLYTFQTRFTQPLYPGFWIYHTNNCAFLKPLE